VSDPLFTPLEFAGLRLKNRIVIPPMGTGLDDDGVFNDAAIAYYCRRAAGAAGTVTVEALLVDPETRGPEPKIFDRAYLPGLRALVEALRPYDVVIGAQLLHPGRQVLSGRRVAPSAIALNSAAPIPDELTAGEIAEIVTQFADAAALAQEAGFDFVEIHGAHGYLPSDFLSPLANHRTDGYGGDLEGRARFPREIVRAIAERCGPALPIFYRLSGEEALPGGFTIDDAEVVAGLLQGEGVACISVSAGHWRSLEVTLAPMFVARGHLVALAARIRQAVSVPVIAVGRLDDPADARRALEEGSADLVAIGRGLIAEPDWPALVAAGREGDIRPCIACNACVDLVGRGEEIRCAVNPEVGRDHSWRPEPADPPRRVAIVGSGPAGMEAARVARLRGHDVSIWERDAQLGGKLEAAASAPSKREVLRFRDFEVRTLRDIGVEIHTGVEVTHDVIEDAAPDVVVVATGAAAVVPPFGGAEGADVHDAQLYLDGTLRVSPGDAVAVIGGSATGCETAEMLAGEGARVTMLEMAPSVGTGIEAITRRHLIKTLRSSGVDIVTGARVTAVEPGRVRFEREGEETAVAADRVALAVGWRSRAHDLVREGDGRELLVVGDAFAPADFVAAVNAGADAGLMA
jgi:2,4-dienoyl-CoA reductase-like NADH-dependent reductase (Old Yellow Enzyme family)/thioredoxin reductase